jgi:hypothetical protein
MVDYGAQGFFKDNDVITLIGDYNAEAKSLQTAVKDVPGALRPPFSRPLSPPFFLLTRTLSPLPNSFPKDDPNAGNHLSTSGW